MKYLSVICIALCTFCTSLSAQETNVTIQVKNYENDTLIVGNYYGNRQLVVDTLTRTQGDEFELHRDSLLDPGVYMVLTLPDYQFVQFVLPEDDQEFSILMNADRPEDFDFKGSEENEVFLDYLTFLLDQKETASALRAKVDSLSTAGVVDQESIDALDALDQQVLNKQRDVVDKHPGTIVAMLVQANFDVDIPTMQGDEEEVKMKRFMYYRDHYFHNLDTSNIALIRTPFIHDRLMYYLDNLYSPLPDSIVKGIDKVLDMLRVNEPAYKFYTSFLLNKYAAGKRVGDDAVYVHISDKYYSQGKAPWVKKETLAKIQDNANKLRPLLIGKILPPITVYEGNGDTVHINDIESEYTVLVFWAPKCGHCTKAMPHIVRFNDKHKDHGIKTISICTKGGKQYKGCWDVLEEKDMLRMQNTGDEYLRFQRKLYVQKTPKIVVLDSEKEILIKDIPAEKLDEIMEEIIRSKKMEEQNKTEE